MCVIEENDKTEGVFEWVNEEDVTVDSEEEVTLTDTGYTGYHSCYSSLRLADWILNQRK